MYIKKDVIYQIQRDFGWTKEKAEAYYNKIDEDMKQEIDNEYHAEAQKSFWED